MENEIHIRTCCRCKCEFESVNKKSYVCPDCRKASFRPAADMELVQLIRIIDRYNERNGTSYSYGKFMQLVSIKKINLREEAKNERLPTAEK